MAKGNAMRIPFIPASDDLGGLEAFPPECFNYTPNCGAAFPGVSFPASSPHVVGVGGTNLVTTYNPPSLDSTYIREQAYSDPSPRTSSTAPLSPTSSGAQAAATAS